jgi:organic hydroperoxide reductase OsmC/OhrA
MEISATVRNANPVHEVVVRTDAAAKTLSLPPRTSGRGSAVNGGELLMLALATCYCNDLYREAERLSIPIESVEVEATAIFPAVGEPATGIRYRAKVSSPAPASAIEDLLRHTDTVSEVQNTLRAGVTVTLVTESGVEAS